MTDDPSLSSAGIGSAGAVALVASVVPFVAGGSLVAYTDLPPSGMPVLGVTAHAFWFLAAVLLATGVTALVRALPGLRRGVAGPLAAGSLAFAAFNGLLWVGWAYVDVRAAREPEAYELVVETVLTPFGAGLMLTYALLIGTGIALLGWALLRANLLARALPLAGVVLGMLTVLTAVASLLVGADGGSDGQVVYNAATLLLPVVYLWAAVVGGLLYRHANVAGDAAPRSDDGSTASGDSTA